MPVLCQETYLYPPDLLAADPELPAPQSWWALYTPARNEKVLMRKLLRQERRFFCPVIARCRPASRRGDDYSYLPLFSNYVFLNGSELDRYAAVKTGHVSCCLPIENPAQFVEQMRGIQQMIEMGLELQLATQFEVGSRVRVKSGPLRGALGHVLKVRNNYRFVVFVDFLRQGASTLLEGWDLEHLN